MEVAWSHFAREGHFHGLREIADRRKYRLFWILIATGAAVCLAWQLEAVLGRFLKDQTGTLIENRVPDLFPSVTICPSSFLDRKAAKKWNVSKDVFDVWEGFLPFGTRFYAVLKDEKMRCPKSVNTNAAVQILKIKFANSLTSALLAVTPEYSDVFQVIKFIPYPIKFQVRKLITWIGLCFSIEPTQKLPYLMQTYGELHIIINKSVEEVRSVAIIPGGQEVNAVNPAVHDIFPVGYDYNIRLSTTWLERVNTRKNPCRGNSYEDWNDSRFYACKLNHFNKNECRDICKTFVPTSSQSLSEYTGNVFDLCNAFNGTLFDCINEVMRLEELGQSSWESHCEKPCYERMHDLQLLPYYPSNATTFRITLAKPELALAVKEFRVYSIDTLISNIGGTVSLWFGASMISFVHLACFLLGLPVHCYKNRQTLCAKNKGNENQALSRKSKSRKVALKNHKLTLKHQNPQNGQ